MNKTKLVPFDVEKAKNGAKVVTRCGYPARIGFYDVKNEIYPILALVQDGEYELPYSFTKNGRYHRNENIDSSYDLFIEVEEVEETDDYDPYKATVESIADMAERYSELQSLEELRHFYNNVRVKCREAVEYNKKWCEKQGEKPADNKPKFQKGDWVIDIDKQGVVHQITKAFKDAAKHIYAYNAETYTYGIFGYSYINETVKGLRRWNINDAKDGDVLASREYVVLFKEIDRLNIKCYCSYYFINTPNFCANITLQGKCLFQPATKEQRELLFKKIKEAGYEWNPDKKELKKIGEVKERFMTYEEVAMWLTEKPYRQYKIDGNTWIYTYFGYYEEDCNEVADNLLIRENGGDWHRPLVEI